MSERRSSYIIGGARRVAIVIVLAGLLSLIANRLAPSPSTRALTEANSGPVLADVPAGHLRRAGSPRRHSRSRVVPLRRALPGRSAAPRRRRPGRHPLASGRD
jgi:hypothetical protein